MSGEVQIPAEAVEAAARARYEAERPTSLFGGNPLEWDSVVLAKARERQSELALTALEAAAPLILAANRDHYLVAYAALHETVRRVLDGEANVKYLRKRHGDIEEDLQRAVEAGRAAVLWGDQKERGEVITHGET